VFKYRLERALAGSFPAPKWPVRCWGQEQRPWVRHRDGAVVTALTLRAGQDFGTNAQISHSLTRLLGVLQLWGVALSRIAGDK